MSCAIIGFGKIGHALAKAFARKELGGWSVAELWADADRLFAVFGLVAAEPAQGS